MKEYKDYTQLRQEIINMLINSGPLTKNDISNRLYLNITTINSQMNELKRINILEVVGKAKSTGGKRANLYNIKRDIGYIIGIDIGSKYSRYILNDIFGDTLSAFKVDTQPNRKSESIIQDIQDNITRIISKSGIPKNNLLGIGLGLSGFIDLSKGYSISCPNIPALNDVPLKDILENNIDLPVFIDDSSHCMAVAEKKIGAAKESNNFICISLGIGIGSGIFIDGKIYRGSIGLSGEIGHIPVKDNGPICNCGNKGCLETIASGPGVIRRAKEAISNGVNTSITRTLKGDLRKLSMEVISEEASNGDKFAFSILDETGEYIGAAIASELNILGSDLVIIGGGIAGSDEILINSIKRSIKKKALHVVSKNLKVVRSELGDTSVAIGAAFNYQDYFFSDFFKNYFAYMNRKKSVQASSD